MVSLSYMRSHSSRYQQDAMQQAQHIRLARDAEAAQAKRKTLSPVRATLIALINLLFR